MSRFPLLMIFLVVFIDLLGFGIVLPLLPRYGEHFNAAGWQLGLLMSSFSAMQFLFAPIWGRLSDHFGRRPILLIGLFGSTLAYAAFGIITQLGNQGLILGLTPLTWLFISRIGAGIAGATISTAQAYIADVTDTKNRGKGMALIGAAFGVGFTFGPILGANFVTANNAVTSKLLFISTVNSAAVSGCPSAVIWASPITLLLERTPPSPAPGYVAAVLSGLALLAAMFLLPESLKPGSDAARHRHWFNRAAFMNAISQPYIGWLLVTIFLSTFAFAQFESTLSILTQRLGLDDAHNFYVFAYIGFILMLAQGFLVRRLLPKLGEFRMAFAGVVLMAVGLLLIGVSSNQNSLTLLYCVLPIAVIGFSAATPSLNAMLSLNTAEDEQGGVLGVGQSFSSLARIFGPYVGLSLMDIKDASLALPYWVAAGTMAVCLLFVLGLRQCRSSRDAAPTTKEAAGQPAVSELTTNAP